MIYDQGFEMRIDKYRFFTYNYYYNETDKDGQTETLSNCAKTIVGWLNIALFHLH